MKCFVRAVDHVCYFPGGDVPMACYSLEECINHMMKVFHLEKSSLPPIVAVMQCNVSEELVVKGVQHTDNHTSTSVSPRKKV